MIRTPLRPLARILSARDRGENPDAIERENLRLRTEAARDRARARAEGRLLLLGVCFFAAFTVIGARMGLLAATDPEEPQMADVGSPILTGRADIVDRNGRVLATNLVTHALYAQPRQMVDPERVATELAQIFPDLDAAKLYKDFTGERKFLWIRRKLSPEQMQAVHDIGDPGLLFGPREMRLYPNGRLASHILGGASFGREGVSSAEIIGTAGVEKTYDDWLRDPAHGGAPLQLSIDMTVQAAAEQILYGGMKLMNAKGATSVLLDVQTGEIVSMVSLPDFDPNNRPQPPVSGDPSDSPIFNRAVQGLYELGSTFKIFAAAQALDQGLVNVNTLIDTRPFNWGRFRIKDMHNYGAQLSVLKIIEKSSNVGSARLALMIGVQRQQEFLKRLGFLTPTSVELVEAPGARPLIPKQWSEISAMTIAYGHGMSASPLHLAAAYASIVNGGNKVEPTLVKRDRPVVGERVISENTSRLVRTLLRGVVEEGTGSTYGNVKGYEVGGKTGTAEKPLRNGKGYAHDKVIGTFASAFPMSDPKYVLIVSLDEGVDLTGPIPRRTAGWTAVPVAAEMIRRIAPLLGLRPQGESATPASITLVKN